jgi:isopentenyl diphosphate isomerase/L-lactate dehydrogenase-like FMN-dependent dehydrogenase
VDRQFRRRFKKWPAAGEHGVREVIQNVLAEFDLTMALTGCATL